MGTLTLRRIVSLKPGSDILPRAACAALDRNTSQESGQLWRVVRHATRRASRCGSTTQRGQDLETHLSGEFPTLFTVRVWAVNAAATAGHDTRGHEPIARPCGQRR